MKQECAQRFLLDLPSVRSDLPFSPLLLNRLFHLTDEESIAPLDAVADAIAEDQGLAARLLAMANSAFYGLQSQVTTIDRALAVLGLREVRSLLMALGVRGLAAKHPLPTGFALSPYLEHQFAVAVVARALARGTNLMDPDDAFTAGVLHDLGKLLTALYRPEDWLAEATLAAAGTAPWHEVEEHYWGIEHGLIGAMMLQTWNLPRILTDPINWHHAPEAAPDHRGPCRLLGLADACVHQIAETTPPGAPEVTSLSLGVGQTPAQAMATAEAALAENDPDLLAAALA